MFGNAALKKELKATKHYLNLALRGYDHAQIKWEYEDRYGKLPSDPYHPTEGAKK